MDIRHLREWVDATIILAIVFVLSAEAAKRWFYHRPGNTAVAARRHGHARG